MAAGLTILALAVLLVGVTIYLNAQRRLERAQAAEAALRAENARLQRAIGAAEQSIRAIANDPRLDSGLGLQVDMALDDLRRASGELGPGA
jgi:multidrug resistance efflux pump